MSFTGERDPLLVSSDDDVENGEEINTKKGGWRERAAERLENKRFRRAIVTLIVIDSILILIDLSYTYLIERCGQVEESPLWVEVLSYISLGISCGFMIEFLVFVWVYGPRYYSPFSSLLHFVDGSIIVGTFVLEVVLRGNERELASLLILFRLIRFAAEAAVGMGELDEENVKELERIKSRLVKRTAELAAARDEIARLKERLGSNADERGD